jgi:hypothetical protein
MNHGYLIVTKYEVLYRKYVHRYGEYVGFYAIPRKDKDPSELSIRYRGIDRDAMGDYKNGDDLAELYMAELAEKDQCYDGFTFTESDARQAFDLLTTPDDYELIWVRIADSGAAAPSGYQSIGFEPSYFEGDHFSPSCDCMMFLRWHGTDEEGVLFLPYYRKLNPYGLFNSVADVHEFLEFYESFDWTEIGPYELVEIFIKGENVVE